MNDGFVADPWVAVSWVHPAQAAEQTRLLLQAVYDGAPVEVHAIWPVEVSNALLVLVRRKKLIALTGCGRLGKKTGAAARRLRSVSCCTQAGRKG